MKNVLIVAPDFVPSSLPPATRARFFATHLEDFGWKPVVLTTVPEFYEAEFDPESSSLLPGSLEVIRTNAIPNRYSRKIGIGDIGMRTLWHHWRAIKSLCSERSFDLVLLSVPPYVQMVLGRLLKRKFGIPYVIDYIDPWVTDYYSKLPRNGRPPKWLFANALSRTLEPIAIRGASHLTGVSSGIADGLINRYSHLNHTDFTEIPYGGETSDFDFIRSHSRPNPIFNPEDGLFHLSYVGACVPGMYPAILSLFNAIRLKLEESPEVFQRLRVHFVGTTYGSRNIQHKILPLAEEAGIAEVVDEHPERVSYLDSLQVMIDSNALTIFGYDEPHYAASKVYPSVISKRPILAILHEDSSPAEILRQIQAGEVVTFGPDDPLAAKSVEIGEKLSRILSRPGSYETLTDWAAFEPYTTRAMTERLTQAFEKALLKNSSSKRRAALKLPLSESQQN